MNVFLTKPLLASLAVAVSMTLTGCGDAETTINEKPSIPADDDDDHDHSGEPGGSSAGRLLIVNAADTKAQVYNLEDSTLLSSIPLMALPSAVYASADYRFATLIERNENKVGFIDGGLWQEAHNDHFDLVQSTPKLSNFSISGARPTHFVTHDGSNALFLDGNKDTGENAGVYVFDDHMVEEEKAPQSVTFSMPQHGVAEPRGEHLVVSIRRADSESTSANFVLPDQVGVYHLDNGAYELEQTFEQLCPDLHGAAQNETHVVFGCSDGLLLVADNGKGQFSAKKLANSAEMEAGLRIGSLWGHHESGQFIGQASSRSSGTIQFFAIDPAENEMALIDWKPEAEAKPIARDFAFEAEQFVILDDKGHITLIEPILESGHTHWQYGERLKIAESDVSMMPEGENFSMTLAQNAHTAYIADPMAKHVLSVDLGLLKVTGDIELDYIPSKITWLGIAKTDDHDH